MVNYEQRSMISYPLVIKRGSLESQLFSSMIFPAMLQEPPFECRDFPLPRYQRMNASWLNMNSE